MIKLTVLYNAPEPDDIEAFKKHYLGTHIPLVEVLPNLDHCEVALSSPGADGAAALYFLIAELYFPDVATLEAAMSSPQGQALVADAPNVAPYLAGRFISEIV